MRTQGFSREGGIFMETKNLKEKYIHVRIEKDFKEQVTKKAKEKGLTLSTLVNMLLREWYAK